MEEKDKKQEENIEKKDGTTEMAVLRVRRHLYPEEIVQKKAEKKQKRMKIIAVVCVCAALGIGWISGSIFPLGIAGQLRAIITRSSELDSTNKIASAKRVMEEDWYFGKDIDDLEERLTDQAIIGITTNEEDPHTQYMSKQETDDFVQSINRNYVGVGVQFINISGTATITRVFKGSPAEKAGIEPGDILYKADEHVLEGLSSDEIKKYVQGDAGTDLMLEVKRGNDIFAFKVSRSDVTATTYGYMLDDQVAYLQLAQFGNSTADEVRAYLDDFSKENATKLIIDLRDNGGGYLTSVEDVASCFLEKGSTVMKREFKDGSITENKTSKDQYSEISPIVVLINQNTASAAEVLTLALREQRDDVTLVGTRSYGKGTVQVSRSFKDGSTIKYTVSKWLSPKGEWINEVGIEPDQEVRLHDVFYHTFAGMKADETYLVDSVGDPVEDMELCLDYLGYGPERKDGYFSTIVQNCLRQYQTDKGMEVTGVLDRETYDSLYSSVILKWETTTDTDSQLAKAREILA